EIQTGCGRTGTWYAFEQHGIVPDVILASKALGGIGMPIAVVFYNKKLDTWAPGAHTATFRGNQLAFAAGIAAAKIIERDRILENTNRQSAHALERLGELERSCDCIGEVRGVGLMLGVEIIDPATGLQDGGRALAIQRRALERGLIVELGGRGPYGVRVLPPLHEARRAPPEGTRVHESAVRRHTERA